MSLAKYTSEYAYKRSIVDSAVDFVAQWIVQRHNEATACFANLDDHPEVVLFDENYGDIWSIYVHKQTRECIFDAPDDHEENYYHTNTSFFFMSDHVEIPINCTNVKSTITLIEAVEQKLPGHVIDYDYGWSGRKQQRPHYTWKCCGVSHNDERECDDEREHHDEDEQ